MSYRDILDAAKGVLWKVNMDHSPSGRGGDCIPAKIDRNDAAIRNLQRAVDAATATDATRAVRHAIKRTVAESRLLDALGKISEGDVQPGHVAYMTKRRMAQVAVAAILEANNVCPECGDVGGCSPDDCTRAAEDVIHAQAAHAEAKADHFDNMLEERRIREAEEGNRYSGDESDEGTGQ